MTSAAAGKVGLRRAGTPGSFANLAAGKRQSRLAKLRASRASSV